MIQEIANALVESWRNFASAFVLFVPRLVAATIIFAGGFFIALLVRRGIQRAGRRSPVAADRRERDAAPGRHADG
jgi:hypothetical protein